MAVPSQPTTATRPAGAPGTTPLRQAAYNATLRQHLTAAEAVLDLASSYCDGSEQALRFADAREAAGEAGRAAAAGQLGGELAEASLMIAIQDARFALEAGLESILGEQAKVAADGWLKRTKTILAAAPG